MPQTDILNILDKNDFREFLVNLQSVDNNLINELLPISEERTYSMEITTIMGAEGTAPIIAKPMADSAETPTAGYLGARGAEVNLFKKGVQRPLFEKAVRALENPNSDPAAQRIARNNIFDAFNLNRRGVLSHIDKERWDVLFKGKVILQSDNLNTVVDYNADPANFIDITTVAGQGWNNPTTAEPLKDIETVLDFMAAKVSGIDYMIMPQKIVSWLKQNKSMREAAFGGFPGVMPRTISTKEINEILQREGFPQIITYDGMYIVEQKNGTLQRVRYTPFDTVLFVPGGVNLGEYIPGYSGEEIKQNGYNAIDPTVSDKCIYSYAYVEHEPFAYWAKAVAVGAPSVPSVNMLARLKVVDGGYAPGAIATPENDFVWTP